MDQVAWVGGADGVGGVPRRVDAASVESGGIEGRGDLEGEGFGFLSEKIGFGCG